MNANSSDSGIVTATISPDLNVVEEEDEHDDHEDDAAQQVVLDGSRREMNEIAAIVERQDLHVLRQDLAVELRGLSLNALEDGLRLLAGSQRDDALDGIVLILVAELTEPRCSANDDLPDVLHEHRRSVVYREHDVPDVFRRRDASEPAHVVELPAFGVEAATGVAIVRVERRARRRSR